MKKKLVAVLLGLMLSAGIGNVVSAKPSIKNLFRVVETAFELIKDSLSNGTQCATEITSSGNEVLKCLPNGGCEWTSGSAVNWGGKC